MTANEYINNIPFLSEECKSKLRFFNDFELNDTSRANLRVEIKMSLEKYVNEYDNSIPSLDPVEETEKIEIADTDILATMNAINSADPLGALGNLAGVKFCEQ